MEQAGGEGVVSCFLILLSLALPVFSARVRSRPGLLLVMWLVLALHHLAALVNCYLTPIPMAGEDALTFDRTAQGLLVDQPYHPYVAGLHLVYHYLGCSQLLGCELSVLAFCLASMVFLALVDDLGYSAHAPILLLLFGCLPAALCGTSVTLRESYQALMILTATWMLMRRHTVGAMLSLLLLALLHNGLALLALGLAMLAALTRPLPGLALLVLALLVCPLVSASSPAAVALSRGTLMQEASTYREGVPAARKTYRAPLDTGSVEGLISTFPRVWLLYMFSPLPGTATGLEGLYGTLESLLRVALCGGILLAGIRRPRLYPLLVLFLLEALWAVGTANWGQAIRHRIVGYGLLVALGAGPWLDLGKRRGFRL